MTVESIQRVFAQLHYQRDKRRAPDERRRGQFRAGWQDATQRNERYADGTLQRLTWRNLGYRLGKHFGDQPPEDVNGAFDALAESYQRHRGASSLLPEEVAATTGLVEGAVCRVSVNAYERNPEARRQCIKAHGAICCICAFSFGPVYGEVAEGFIHVHHLRALSEISGEYQVDPVNDLRPVCPNCHAVLHRRIPAFSIDEVRALVRRPGGQLTELMNLDEVLNS